jgi:hypothetical protein
MYEDNIVSFLVLINLYVSFILFASVHKQEGEYDVFQSVVLFS